MGCRATLTWTMLLGEDFPEVGDIMRIYDQKWGLHGIHTLGAPGFRKGWGAVGWGNNVHVNLHTHVMLRYGYLGVGWGGVGWGGAITFMSTCTHTSCYVMVILGWGGVGQ